MQQRFNQILWGLNFIFIVSFFVIMAQYVLSVLGQWGSDKFFQRSDIHLLKGQILEDAFQIGLICFGLILLAVYLYTLKVTKSLKTHLALLEERPNAIQREKEMVEEDFMLTKTKLLQEISSLQAQIKKQQEENGSYHQGVNLFTQEIRNILNEFCQINLSAQYPMSLSSLWDETEIQNQIFFLESLQDRVTGLGECLSELDILTFNTNVELNEYACLHPKFDSNLDARFSHYTANSKKLLDASSRLLENTKKLLSKNEEYLQDLAGHEKELKKKNTQHLENLQEELTQRINSILKVRESLQEVLGKQNHPGGEILAGDILEQSIIAQNKSALNAPISPVFS